MFDEPTHRVAMMCDWTMDVLGEGLAKGQSCGLCYKTFNLCSTSAMCKKKVNIQPWA